MPPRLSHAEGRPGVSSRFRVLRRHWAVGLAFAALLVLSSTSAASERFGKLLGEADAIRSADPAQFTAKLDQLSGLKAEATPSQRSHLQLLQAYRDAYQGRYDAASRIARDLFEHAPDIGLRFRAAMLAANIAAATRDFLLGLRYLELGMSLFDEIDDAAIRQQGLGVAAVLYNQLGQYELGREYAERLIAQPGSGRQECFGVQLRMEALKGLEAWPNQDEVDSAIGVCEAQKEVVLANFIRSYAARDAAEHGRMPAALQLLRTHMPEVEAAGYQRLTSEFHALLAEYLFATGSPVAARRHAGKALVGSDPGQYPQPIVAAERVLYLLDRQDGDLRGALTHYQRYAEADKARLDDIRVRELAFQQSRNDLQKKNRDIDLLSKRNEVLRLQQLVDRKSAQNNRLALILLVVVLAALAYWAYKVKRVQLSFRRLAEYDGLTGISNRRHFRDQTERALARCEARGQPFGLVLFDMDLFKRINDHYGHAVGDWVLKEVASVCQAQCRKDDLFGRIGGEEFALSLPNCDLAATQQIASQCRQRIAAIDSRKRPIDGSAASERFAITASFGCTGSKLSGYDFERLLSAADMAMYDAKAYGRDHVSTSPDGLPHRGGPIDGVPVTRAESSGSD